MHSICTHLPCLCACRSANYISWPPNLQRRYDEIYYAQYEGYGFNGTDCDVSAANTTCPKLLTSAVYDWKWYSQVTVCPWEKFGKINP